MYEKYDESQFCNKNRTVKGWVKKGHLAKHATLTSQNSKLLKGTVV
jgi:hypothetical protein